MKNSTSTKSVIKVVRIVKYKANHVIKWQLKDNLCLLYAIWEMCTKTQKNVLTVSCLYDSTLFYLSLIKFRCIFQMKGTLSFVETFKESMGYLPTQKVLKGISSEDVNVYFRWLSSLYSKNYLSLTYVWKRVKKVDSSSYRTFTGSSVYPLLSSTPGQYIMFGKAKWNNDKHRTLMKKLRSLQTESLRFKYYGVAANGRKAPDHAVGLVVSSQKDPSLYDNSMRNVGGKFSAEALANKMSDVSSCYIFDVRLSK